MNYAIQKKRTKILAVVMLFIMAFSILAPAFQQMGVLPDHSYVTTALATDNSGQQQNGQNQQTPTTSGGLSDITITSDGNVSFGNAANVDTNTVLAKGKDIVTIILSVGSLLCLAFLIISIVKFAQSGDNEQMRRKAIGGILTTLLGTALLGSVTFWYAFSYNAIK